MVGRNDGGVCMRRRHKSNYIFVPDRQSGGSGWLWLVLLAVVALGALMLLMNHVSNGRVRLSEEKVSMMALDKTFEGFTILHLSDLHAADLGSDIEAWKKLLSGNNFHAVVMSGDMVGSDNDYEPLLSLIHTLRTIKADVPIYLLSGDDDPAPVITTAQGTPEALANWVRAAVQMGATYLDAPIAQKVGKRTVWFVHEYLYDVDAEGMVLSLTNQKSDMEASGQQYEANGGASYRALCYRLDAMQRTVEAQKAMLDTDLQVAVNHSPLTASYIRTSLEWADQTRVFNFRNIGLLLCGHVCAGQWRLPGLGPIYMPDMGWFPGDSGLIGMQRINSINQYISPGLGASEAHPLKGRMFNSPTATLLKFTGAIQ